MDLTTVRGFATTWPLLRAQVHSGEFALGREHGQGRRTYPDGSVFEGEYNRGVVEGRGTFQFADGSTEVGRWEDGWPVGEATRFSPDHKHAWRLAHHPPLPGTGVS